MHHLGNKQNISQILRYESKTLYIAILIIVASFGPYLIPQFGLQLIHILLYPLVIIIISIHILRGFIGKKSAHILLGLWSCLIIWVFLVSVLVSGKLTLSLLASIENYFQIMAIILISMYITHHKSDIVIGSYLFNVNLSS